MKATKPTALKLFSCQGGDVILPAYPLIDRLSGGNLVINPPREVWERGELSADELISWSFLNAATAQAMLDTLPQLRDGCINYWEAGNWGVNEQAEPKGFKSAQKYRKVHMHLLGRNPYTKNPDFRWGEAPNFPDYADYITWAEKNEPLNAEECNQIIMKTKLILENKYHVQSDFS